MPVLRSIGRLRSVFEKRISYDVALRAAMSWLKTAQDATTDDGVAHSYCVDAKRWTSSYPETTGYIIPTFFDYAALTQDPEFRRRAILMANWEQTIQLAEGGIQASIIGARPVVPAVFNTGMVIFGWLRTYQETGDSTFLCSARKAAQWLLKVQEHDGSWRRYSSPLTVNTLNTYNTRVAWALLELDRTAPEECLRQAARLHLDWALMQQIENGWIDNNCFFDNAQPYTHTIGYAIRGFLESGVLLGDVRYLEAAERAFRGVQPAIQRTGFLAARFDRHWRATASYGCLCGNSQLALNGFRLYEITGKASYRSSAELLLCYVLRTQQIQHRDPNIAGGIAGSWPLDGEYQPGQYPNWAAKFIADALMFGLKLRP